MHGIVDPVLAFLHLDFGRPTDADHRYPASELGEPLLQLLAIIVRSRLFDLRLDLLDAALDTTDATLPSNYSHSSATGSLATIRRASPRG